MESKQSLKKVDSLSESLANDNDDIISTIDSVVAHVACQPDLDQRSDWPQIHTTFRTMILNSLIHGESHPIADADEKN